MAKAEGGTRGRPRAPELDEAISRAALELMGEVGFSRLTIEGVAAKAGVGKAAVYRRWKSKTALVVDVLTQVVLPITAPDESDPERAVKSAVLVLYDRMILSEWRDVILSVVGEISRDPELAALYRANIVRPRLAALQEIVRKGIDAGAIRDDLPTRIIARLLLGPLAYSALVEGDLDSREDVVRLVDEVWTLIKRPG